MTCHVSCKCRKCVGMVTCRGLTSTKRSRLHLKIQLTTSCRLLEMGEKKKSLVALRDQVVDMLSRAMLYDLNHTHR